MGNGPERSEERGDSNRIIGYNLRYERLLDYFLILSKELEKLWGRCVSILLLLGSPSEIHEFSLS